MNVTVLSGGTADNVIPDFAQASVDVRIPSVEEARRIEACFRQVPDNPVIKGVRVEVKGELSRMPMVPSKKTERLWERVAAIGQRYRP